MNREETIRRLVEALVALESDVLFFEFVRKYATVSLRVLPDEKIRDLCRFFDVEVAEDLYR